MNSRRGKVRASSEDAPETRNSRTRQLTLQFCGSRSNLHHNIYRSHGGSDAEGNLITACAKCHQGIQLATCR